MRKVRIAIAAAAVSLLAAQAWAQAAGPLYLFVYRQGPSWEAGKPLTQQKLGPHGAYMRRLMTDGKLVAGGPWAEGDGGMAIVRAESAEAAKALLAADPAITAGVFAADIRVWQPAIDSGKPLRP